MKSAYNSAKGDVYTGQLEFDDGSRENAAQISVSVRKNKQATGVPVAAIKLTC